MSGSDVKSDLHGYLRGARETLVWKLDGLGEYDIRRPLTPTGTNLLGLVKHSAGTHLRYFGDVFGRTCATALPWMSNDAEPNADIIRELIDGSAGLLDGHSNLRIADPAAWRAFVGRIENDARRAAGDDEGPPP